LIKPYNYALLVMQSSEQYKTLVLTVCCACCLILELTKP
jgi:hypothetical protein